MCTNISKTNNFDDVKRSDFYHPHCPIQIRPSEFSLKPDSSMDSPLVSAMRDILELQYVASIALRTFSLSLSGESEPPVPALAILHSTPTPMCACNYIYLKQKRVNFKYFSFVFYKKEILCSLVDPFYDTLYFVGFRPRNEIANMLPGLQKCFNFFSIFFLVVI